MDPKDLTQVVLAAAAVAGVILLFAWGLASSASRRDTSAPAAAASFAIGLGTLAGFGLLAGWNLQPRESWLWLIWVFPLAAFAGAYEAREAALPAQRWGARLLLVAVSIGLVLHKTILPSGGKFELQKAALYLGAPLAVMALWHYVLPRLGAGLGALALWLASSGTALMLLFAGSVKLLGIGAALAGGLGALIVACRLRPSPGGMAGAITPAAMILSALAFLSIEFSGAKYSPWLFAAVALAPLFGLTPFLRRPWMRAALIAIPIAAAAALAFRTYDTSAL